MRTITHPQPGYNGPGPAGLMFIDGTAETDDPAAIGYCQGAGYVVDGEQLNTSAAGPAPVPVDSRDVVTQHGSPNRDAATDPRVGDNPPAGAGTADPHGPGVASDPSQAARIAAAQAATADAGKGKGKGKS